MIMRVEQAGQGNTGFGSTLRAQRTIALKACPWHLSMHLAETALAVPGALSYLRLLLCREVVHCPGLNPNTLKRQI